MIALFTNLRHVPGFEIFRNLGYMISKLRLLESKWAKPGNLQPLQDKELYILWVSRILSVTQNKLGYQVLLY